MLDLDLPAAARRAAAGVVDDGLRIDHVVAVRRAAARRTSRRSPAA